MLYIGIPLAVCILGILIWALAGQPIPKRAGEYMFACGLLVTLLAFIFKGIKLP